MEKSLESKLQSILDELENVKSEMTMLVEVGPTPVDMSKYLDDALESLDDVIGRVTDSLDKIM